MATKPTLRIGCAGWAIPATERARFAAGDSVLARYATLFDAVEINSSFYRSHLPATYARWAASVPAAFRFSVKVPRTITHDARLVGVSDALSRFIDEAGALGDRLGAILIQLPPSLAWNKADAGRFFRMLRRRFDGRAACEPRHRSWFAQDAETMLAQHSIARVAADPPVHAGGDAPGGGGDWQYWRLHGSPRVYYSPYAADALQTWHSRLAANASIERWCMFDNTAQGHAIPDALALKSLFA
ncbi:MAG: DUF72 domain-containing protein [Luteimonas sp.]